MKTTIYKPGGEHNVWGKKAHVKVVEQEDVAQHLKDGWLEDPAKLIEEDKPKRGRKPKAETDGDSD